MAVPDETKLRMYRTMFLSRRFEETIEKYI